MKTALYGRFVSVTLIFLPCVLITDATVYMTDHCGKRIILAGDRLRSQKDDYYRNNIECMLQLQAPQGFESIRLDFDWIDFERDSETYECNDYLDVYFGTNTSKPLEHYCGVDLESYELIHESSPIMTLFMKTNSLITSRGFSLIFTAVKPPHSEKTDECTLEREFHCTNYYSSFCIDNSVVCDCKNNCGDEHDEKYCDTCKADEIYGSGLSVGAIIGIVLAIMVFGAGCAAVVFIVYKKNIVKGNANHTRQTNETTENHETLRTESTATLHIQ
ncbi:uncharacterized protein [Ptychodera flava]|uniref:uncharacterized protein isoform X2 n=1 Tax=Ptychodera flava TaxID=63121 RepID=UPI00396A3811